jgi:hypothetical protein
VPRSTIVDVLPSSVTANATDEIGVVPLLTNRMFSNVPIVSYVGLSPDDVVAVIELSEQAET